MPASFMQFARQVEVDNPRAIVGAEPSDALYGSDIYDRTLCAYTEAFTRDREHPDGTKFGDPMARCNVVGFRTEAESSRPNHAELVNEQWGNGSNTNAIHVSKERLDPVAVDEVTVLVNQRSV